MNTVLLRSVALVGASALVLTSFLGSAPAQAAPGDGGTLTVNVVDQYGQPAPGFLYTVNSDGEIVNDEPTKASGTFTQTVPAGGYAFQSITPWGGLVCAGYSPCSGVFGFPEDGSTVTPVVTVADDATSVYTLKVVVPSVSGGSTVGSALTVNLPQGLKDLETALSYSDGETTPDEVDLSPTVQWRRGSVGIPGAVDDSYTTTVPDGGQAVAARLTPAPLSIFFFFTVPGLTARPMTTNPVAVATYVPRASTTSIKIPKRLQAGTRSSIRLTVASSGGAVTGAVRVRFGKITKQAVLQDGVGFVTLPKFNAQKKKITIKASFLGGPLFAPSAATTKVKVGAKKRT